MLRENKNLIVIAGPTAVGKTSLSLELARAYDAEIISADSRQIYKEMNIGTAKVTIDERNQIPHHFIDIKHIEEEYSAGQYETEVIAFLSEYYKNKSVAILVGGTGLYINAVLNGLDIFPNVPKIVLDGLENDLQSDGLQVLQKELEAKDPRFYAQADIQNHRRVIRALSIIRHTNKTFSSFQNKANPERSFKAIPIVLTLPREELYERINKRVDLMMHEGLLAEVKSLVNYTGVRALNTVGYKELLAYLENKMNLDTAVSKIKQHSRNYAKRQITWFNNRLNAQQFSPKAADQIVEYIEGEINS